MRHNGTLQKGISGLLVACLLVVVTGCYGSFAVTKKVHQVNDEVSENKWVDEVVFLVFAILPVYSIATLVDAVIVNSIEFWTGDNPMSDDGDDGGDGGS